jgi:hypothetical protein
MDLVNTFLVERGIDKSIFKDGITAKLLQIAKMLSVSNFGSLRNLVSNKTELLRNNIIR